jgi:hypothetical protein
VFWLTLVLHPAAPETNLAPTAGAGERHSACPTLVEHVDPRQQTPAGGQVLFGPHTVFGPRHVPLNRTHRFRFNTAQLVTLQHAPTGMGQVTVMHVEPML